MQLGIRRPTASDSWNAVPDTAQPLWRPIWSGEQTRFCLFRKQSLSRLSLPGSEQTAVCMQQPRFVLFRHGFSNSRESYEQRTKAEP